MSEKKMAVMYGAGGIGRGFLGQLFYLSGYDTVFIDAKEQLAAEINRCGQYPIYITNGDRYEPFIVNNVSAVAASRTSDVAKKISEAYVMATAVGANYLKHIASDIIAGLRMRMVRDAEPLNIIICENIIDADVYLRTIVCEQLNEAEKAWCQKNVGFVEASIGRMIPAVPEHIKTVEPLAVCVEPYSTLPVNKKAIVGETPDIYNLLPSEPFQLYVRRKLYMHYMSHAITAYLGAIYNYKYIYEASGDFGIRFVTLGALTEASNALAREFRIDNYTLLQYSFDLLSRFDNRLLGDTIARVGRDTARKLSADDRICGLIRLCHKNSVTPHYVMIGLAAALHFNCEGDESSREVYEFTRSNGVRAALAHYSGITDPAICERTERLYNMLGKAPLLDLINLPD